LGTLFGKKGPCEQNGKKEDTVSKRTIFIAVIALPFLLLFVLLVLNPIDQSTNSQEFYATMKDPPSEAKAWSTEGSYFSWPSSLEDNTDFGPLKVFYRSFGSRDKPAIVMIHGFPTSSYDFSEIIAELKSDFHIVVVDTPGYGFSDKPRDGYRYSIFEDAQLVDTLIRDVVKLDRFTLLTHDKGDSVGFAFLQMYQSLGPHSYTISHHIILNGGIYLPLAQLSVGQQLMTTPVLGRLATRLMSPRLFAKRFGKLYSPELTPTQATNLASIFAYQGGVSVMHETIKYLDQRRENEVIWLKALRQSDVAATLIWGEQDPIATTAIADFVWENYLRDRPASATYWRISCASHYPQNDQPEIIAGLVRQAITGVGDMDLSESDCAPDRVE